MTLTRRDALATLFTLLAACTPIVAHQAWGVPLIGDSYRWAALATLALGFAAYLSAEPLEGYHEPVLGVLGIVALALGILALATGSLVFLSLLVAVTILLWAGTTIGHVRHRGRRSISI
jgi:hypothetical protein